MKLQLLVTFALIFFTTLAFSQDQYLKITFEEGPLKGTHVFTKEKGNYNSQIGGEYFDAVSKVHASKVKSASGIFLLKLDRSVLGEFKAGEMTAKKYTKGCGSLNFLDSDNTQSYKKIYGSFTGCSSTAIESVGAWNKKRVYKKNRAIAGSFKDDLKVKMTMDDGTVKEELWQVTVIFKIKEGRRK